MKYAYLSLLSFLLTIISFPSFAQETEEVSPCAVNQAMEKLFEENPESKAAFLKADAELEAFTQANILEKGGDDTLIIPVVFHIIHLDGPENVSKELIHETIDRLNIDYMALNDDTSDVIPEFADLIPVTNIQFRLATKDPDGNCTSGITRTVSGLTYVGDDQVKQLIRWPRNKYLNVWVVNDIEFGAAAYAYYPGAVTGSDYWRDGIVCRFDYLGMSVRTLTHEVGHYLNLRHVWGNSNDAGLPGNCSDDDLVSDTPLCIGNFGGCPLYFESCGSLDNVQNYMNYSSCDRMFTEGQSNRMRAALMSSTAQRSNLWKASNLAATGTDVVPTLCAADFYIENDLGCVGSEVEFIDDSYNGEITSWNWTFEGGTPATSNETNPVVVYNEGGSYTVTLTVSDGVNEFTTTKENYVHVLPVGSSTPFNENFEAYEDFPNENWFISGAEAPYWTIHEVGASGPNSAYLRNRLQDEGEKDELISSTVDLSNVAEAELSFKYAFAKRHDDDTDILRIRISRNCGGSWVVKKSLKASNGTLVTAPNKLSDFTPNEDQWEELTISLSSLYYIENFRYKFEFINGNGNNVYIDDIRIYDPTIDGINEINKAALNFNVYPNPVNSNLTVKFNLLESAEVLVEVYDIAGRKVETLFNRNFALGTHQLNYDASKLEQGVYFVKLTIEGESFTNRFIKN